MSNERLTRTETEVDAEEVLLGECGLHTRVARFIATERPAIPPPRPIRS